MVFVRRDLNGFEIPASWRYVKRVSYATSLMRQSVWLLTTEHLLSALRALGIDNVRAELDNLEVPIFDGSAQPFADMLAEAGVRPQRRPRRYLRILRRVEVTDGSKHISIEPGTGFAVAYTTCYRHPLVGSQAVDMRVTPQTYVDHIAPARTFGFQRNLDKMREDGLIRGATLENAVCFTADGVLNEGGLRFPDEPCRHKLLDLIGDLALLGYPLIGRVVATRAGHAMHTALVDRIMNDPASYEIVTLDQVESPAG